MSEWVSEWLGAAVYYHFKTYLPLWSTVSWPRDGIYNKAGEG